MTIHQKFSAAHARSEDHRLFFALLPPPDIAARIGRLRDTLGARGSLVRDDRLHITTHILDDLPFAPPERIIDGMIEAANSVKAFPPDIILDKLSSHGRTSCLMPSKTNPALKAFQAELAAAMARSGLTLRHGWTFSPHVTLLYNPQVRHTRSIAPIRWQASEFVLIHSLLGKTQHIAIDRWPLIEQPRLI